MYGYVLHFPAPIDVYLTMHRAVLEVLAEDGGSEGLLVHFAYPTDEGFDLTEVWESKDACEAFNRDVFPKAMSRTGLPMGRSRPEPVDFVTAALMTPRAFSSDAA